MLKVEYRATPPVVLSEPNCLSCIYCTKMHGFCNCLFAFVLYSFIYHFHQTIILMERNTFLRHVKSLQQDINICGQRYHFYNSESYQSGHCYPLLYLQSRNVLPL